MRRSISSRVLVLALPLTLLAGMAFAQSAAPVVAPAAPVVDVRAACKSDMDAFCPGVERGESRRACVDANKDKFSDSCKAARSANRDANQDRREAFRAACADDVAKLCATAPKGQGQVVECIRANADKVTSACKTKLSELPVRDLSAAATK